MLHIAHACNTILDEHLWQLGQKVTKITDAWKITKRIILATLLVASAALFYLVRVINEVLLMSY